MNTTKLMDTNTPKKLTAIVNLPQWIFDKNCTTVLFLDETSINSEMIKLQGQRIIIKPCNYLSYAYMGEDKNPWYWKSEWLKDIREEPEPVDWSKVAVDTKCMVKGSERRIEFRRYFARYEDGGVFCWEDGRTSWTEGESKRVSRWPIARLATEEDEK